MLTQLQTTGRVDQPRTGGRDSVQVLSAWHRTAKSLVARGYAKLVHNGSVYWLVTP